MIRVLLALLLVLPLAARAQPFGALYSGALPNAATTAPLCGSGAQGAATACTSTVVLPALNLAGSKNVSSLPVYANGTGFVFGTNASPITPYYFTLSDQANVPFSSLFNFFAAVGGGSYSGGRNLANFNIHNAGSLPSGNGGILVADQNYAYSALTSGGVSGSVSPFSYTGSLFGGDDNVYLTASKGWQGLYSREFDMAIDSNSSAAIKNGINVVLTSNDARRGEVSDAAITINAQNGSVTQGWRCGLCYGASTSDWSFGTDSVLIGIEQRAYSGSVITPVAAYGTDWRALTVTAGGAAFTSQGFGVDPTGNTSAASLTTAGSVTAQTATVSGITITDGGAWDAIPSLTIQAPPSGTTAIAAVSGMGLSSDAGNGVFAIISNGTSGCTNGATVSVVGGTASVTATATITVAGGVVTSAAVATPGTYTALPSNPATLSGSGCSGALTATLTWGITGINVSNAGSGYLAKVPPLVTATFAKYHAATLTAAMATVAAPLALGGSLVSVSALLSLQQFTVAGLATCNAGNKFKIAEVSDATSPTFLATVTGGGAVAVPVMCNGTNWVSF